MTQFYRDLWHEVSSRVRDLREQPAFFRKIKVGESEFEITQYPSNLLPNRASTKYFETWETELSNVIEREGIAVDDVPLLFSMAFYGPSEAPTTKDWTALREFVESWIANSGCVVDRWQRCDLVFCYGMGIGRKLSTRSSVSSWSRLWNYARSAFDQFSNEREIHLQGVLSELGILDNPPRKEAGNSRYCLDILLENSVCPCVGSYLTLHPKAKVDVVTERHHREHRFQAWLDRSERMTPKEGSSQQVRPFFPILHYVIRALEGEAPGGKKKDSRKDHVRLNLKSLDKGLLFETLDPRPVVFTSLLCNETRQDSLKTRGKCGSRIQDFDYCEDCSTQAPRFERAENQLRSPNDHSWRPAISRKCVNCDRYFELTCSEPTETQRLCRYCREQEVEIPNKKPGNPFQVWVHIPQQNARGFEIQAGEQIQATAPSRSEETTAAIAYKFADMQEPYKAFQLRAKNIGVYLPPSLDEFFEKPLMPKNGQHLFEDPFMQMLKTRLLEDRLDDGSDTDS